jgi:hypothetical protein
MMHIPRLAVLVTIALAAAACGASDTATESEPPTDFVVQGDQALDTDAITTTSTTEAAASDGASGAGESAGNETEAFESTSDTLPQNEDEGSAIGGLFEAFAVFRTCLDEEGYAFIGRPDPTLEATDPVNDSGYGEALGKCAAVSDIVNAVEAQQSESENLDTEGIETRNRQLVLWVDCMEGRGFVISEITTNERGLNQPTNIEAPEGQSLFDSDDMAECATIAAQLYDEQLAAENEGDGG